MLPSKLSAREVLLEAALLIEERGLAKGEMIARTGEVCSLQAIALASTAEPVNPIERALRERCAWRSTPEQLAPARLFAKHIALAADERSTVNYPAGTIIVWNNRAETTKETVIAAMRAAAEEDDGVQDG